MNLAIDGLVTALGTEILLAGRDLPEWAPRFGDWDRRIIDELMAGEGMAPHSAEMQTPFKASFAVPAERAEEVKAMVMERLPDTRVILSGQSDFDAIPAAGGKDKATLHIAEWFGIPRERLVVAGDSGNDLAMFETAAMAIAVGNARSELVARADPVRTYFAKAGHAGGILEGLRHWGALRPTPDHHA